MKKILNFIMAFLLTILILGDFVVIILSNTILNKEYILEKLDENNYYEAIETDLENGFEEYEYQSGLPSEVFKNLYISDTIKKDVGSIVEYWYEGILPSINSENIKNQIDANINNYLSNQQITLTEQETQNIEQFEELIVNVYEEKVNVLQNQNEKITKLLIRAKEMLGILKVGLIVLTILILICCLLINKGAINQFLITIGITLLSSGILLNMANYLINKNIDIKNILIITQSMSDAIKSILEDILSKFSFYGVFSIILGLMLIVINNYNKVEEK